MAYSYNTDTLQMLWYIQNILDYIIGRDFIILIAIPDLHPT